MCGGYPPHNISFFHMYMINMHEIRKGGIVVNFMKIRNIGRTIGIENRLVFSIGVDQLGAGIEDALNEVFGQQLTIADWKKTAPGSIDFPGSMYGKTRGQGNLKTPPILFNGWPIWLDIKSMNSRDGGYQVTFLCTINTEKARQNLKVFIRKLYAFDLKIKSKKPPMLWTTTPFNQMGLVESKEFSGYRTFDTVFIPEETKKSIKKSLDGFVTKRDWYKKNTLRYHYGILLYGPPGTGKSVTVQAIADYLNADMYLIPTDGIGHISSYLDKYGSPQSDRLRVVVVEDIDRSYLFSKKETGGAFIIGSGDGFRNGFRPGNVGGLGNLLNYLDGTDSPENIVFVFTTNHIETLDPALIRPGRCDLKLEIKPINLETLNQFMKFHFNKELHDIEIPQGLTFAYLQNELIRGSSFDEICEYIKTFKPENFKEEENNE